jgi:hypothetical protein
MQNGSERRGGPRFEVFAQASIISGGDSYLMSVRNVSAGGAFLEGSTREHPDLRPGVAIEIVLSPAAAELGDEELVNIRCRGVISRLEMGTPRQPGGFGVTLEPATAADRRELEGLLRRLSDPRMTVPASSAG